LEALRAIHNVLQSKLFHLFFLIFSFLQGINQRNIKKYQNLEEINTRNTRSYHVSENLDVKAISFWGSILMEGVKFTIL